MQGQGVAKHDPSCSCLSANRLSSRVAQLFRVFSITRTPCKPTWNWTLGNPLGTGSVTEGWISQNLNFRYFSEKLKNFGEKVPCQGSYPFTQEPVKLASLDLFFHRIGPLK